MITQTRVGRITVEPELKTVNVKGEDRLVCEFRVADIMEGGFLNVEAWKTHATYFHKNFRKGDTIAFEAHQGVKSSVQNEHDDETRHYHNYITWYISGTVRLVNRPKPIFGRAQCNDCGKYVGDIVQMLEEGRDIDGCCEALLQEHLQKFQQWLDSSYSK